MSDTSDEEPEEESLAETANDSARSGIGDMIAEAVAWVGTGIAKLFS